MDLLIFRAKKYVKHFFTSYTVPFSGSTIMFAFTYSVMNIPNFIHLSFIIAIYIIYYVKNFNGKLKTH
jgi:hypothetical protein